MIIKSQLHSNEKLAYIIPIQYPASCMWLPSKINSSMQQIHILHAICPRTHTMLTWLTLHTSIISMAITVGRDAYSIAWTVHESSLGTSAAQVIQEDGASTLAKECIGMHHSTYTSQGLDHQTVILR